MQVQAGGNMNTGRWGEELVARQLKATLKSAVVTWVNEEEERGLPYDIVIVEPNDDATSGYRESFIEVKATTSADKALFEVSMAELDFARQQGAAYALYRVFNARSQHALVAKLHNVSRCIGHGGLVLFAGVAGTSE